MFRAKWKLYFALLVALVLAAIWRAFPVKFGLAGNPDDDTMIKLADSDAIYFPMGLKYSEMDPSPEIKPLSGDVWVFRDLRDIDQLIPALKSKRSPIELNRNDLFALIEKKGDPLECKSFNFIPQKQTGVKFKFENPELPTGEIYFSYGNNFRAWSDAAHSFEDQTMVYKEGMTVLVEEKTPDGRPMLEFSAINVGTRIYTIFSPDVPAETGINKCMTRNQSDAVFARIPADREGLFAFKIQSPEVIILTRQPVSSNSKLLISPSGGLTLSNPTVTRFTMAPPASIYSTSFSSKFSGEETVLVLDIHPGK